MALRISPWQYMGESQGAVMVPFWKSWERASGAVAANAAKTLVGRTILSAIYEETGRSWTCRKEPVCDDEYKLGRFAHGEGGGRERACLYVRRWKPTWCVKENRLSRAYGTVDMEGGSFPLRASSTMGR